MIRASRYYKMYSIWMNFTSLNEYLLDRGEGLGLVAKGTDCDNDSDWLIYVVMVTILVT